METIEQQDKTSRNNFRLLVGAAAATLVVVAGVTAAVLASDDGGNDTKTVPPAEETEPGPATTRPDLTTTTSTTVDDSGQPSTTIRDVDWENRTYENPCPSLIDEQFVTLENGSAGVLTGPEQSITVELSDVSYVDADSDGEEEAVVALFCFHPRAEMSASWVGAFNMDGIDGERSEVPIGEPIVNDSNGDYPSNERPVLDGDQVTTLAYPEPGTGAEDLERVWKYNGTGFDLIHGPEAP